MRTATEQAQNTLPRLQKNIVYITATERGKKEGYIPKKSKGLEKEHLQAFISDAPDSLFLVKKLALIFGVFGAMRKDELLKLQTDDVQDLGSKYLVTVKASKTHTNRIFTIFRIKISCNS
ncbi:hypothetical protein QE152_g1782 [Popillia japonica]|uniref:Tyr recombinase domain-containing protein n=1 Tax=Popillia japonica TaxID=7064 RepID=A0AAW1N1M2_POPJA